MTQINTDGPERHLCNLCNLWTDIYEKHYYLWW